MRQIRQSALALSVTGVVGLLSGVASAGVTYSSTTDASWFNPANWNNGNGATATNAGPTSSDADIFSGQGYTTLSPDGVVFDPVSDPNYSTTFQATSPTNPTTVNTTTYTTIPQLYLAGGSSSTTVTDLAGKLTLKSGTLVVSGGSTGVAVGRPQLNANPAGTSERSALILNGGSISITASNGDLQLSSGQTTGSLLSFGQTNVLDYTNTGSINSTAKSAGGLRLNTQAGASGTTSNSTVILRHTAAGTGQLNFASVIAGAASATAGASNSTFEYHYGGGNVDTINVGVGSTTGNSLKLNEGSTTGGGTYNTYLNLLLDSAPTITGGNVQSLGLFDVQGTATGITVTNGSISASSGFSGLGEGSTVSASFGGNTYSWTLYYDGNINGSTITGAGTGADVVLIGNAFTSTPEPASVSLLGLAGVGLLRRRRA